MTPHSISRAALGAACLLTVPASSPAQTWEPVPLVTARTKAAGHLGGEGGQWPRALAVDSTGAFVLFGTDVGGLFRSRDGGRRWEPCNVGYTPRGTSGLAIDPHHPRRVLSIGSNSVVSEYHGVWISTDGAASWRQAYKVPISGSQDNREQIAFDPATDDPKAGRTRVVYWSRVADDRPGWGKAEAHPALYKSLDGGETWAEVPNTAAIGGSVLRVHPTRGVVYAANPAGVWRSEDGGRTFQKTLAGDAQGIDVSAAAPDRVWASRPDGVWRSDDRGKTWAKLPGSARIADGSPLRNVKVSPVDPDRLVLWREGANWNWPRLVSWDGGATWQEAKIDSADAFLPQNARQGLFVWSPKRAGDAWSVGGDWPTRSGDGGRTWRWSGDGDNALLIGGAFTFCAQDPDVLYFGSQDYNGAKTTDGGKTWAYINAAGNGWGGFTYGGYALNADVLWVGNASGWGAPRLLRVSRDGGRTWTEMHGADGKPLAYAGPDAAAGDPADPSVGFASNWRTADAGRTWAAMSGCDAVLTASPGPDHALYGIHAVGKDTEFVRSTDHGTTWTVFAAHPGQAGDLAWDAVRSRLYARIDGALWIFEKQTWRQIVDLPEDQGGAPRVSSVAVDPVDPAVVYVTTNRDVFSSSASVLRSTDAGAHWTNLTVHAPLAPGRVDGGREAIWVRVHPKTRYAYVATSCYGLWRIAPPR